MSVTLRSLITLFTILMSLSCMTTASYAYISTDWSLNLETDALPYLEREDSLHAPPPLKPYFKDLLLTRRLNVNDTNVRYPKFIDFCMRVYRWYTRTFATYNPEYVSGIKKHGKLRLVSDNWANTYYFRTSDGIPIAIASNPYSNLGFSVNYYALSYGYSWDITTVFHGTKAYHHKQTVSFTASRLYADAYIWKNNGSAKLRSIGIKNEEQLKDNSFDGIQFKAYGLNAYYIFNYSKFCFGAAYNLSHHQLKSQGSWMLGISLAYNDCRLDFSKLIDKTLNKLELPQNKYRFFYDTLAISGGYSYNWVLGKHWLYNITVLPSVGISGSKNESTTGKKALPGLMLKGRSALNYFSDQFFMMITLDGNGNFFISKDLRYISGIFNLQVSTGIRF